MNAQWPVQEGWLEFQCWPRVCRGAGQGAVQLCAQRGISPCALSIINANPCHGVGNSVRIRWFYVHVVIVFMEYTGLESKCGKCGSGISVTVQLLQRYLFH